MRTGGDMDEIVCNHPDLGVIRFSPKANETFNIDAGGIKIDDDSNGITSQGEMILKKTRSRWFIEGAISLDDGFDTITNIKNICKSNVLGVWTFTHLSGLVLKGKGTIVGDINGDMSANTLSLKVAGGGDLEKIS